jgi:hypothetical protein
MDKIQRELRLLKIYALVSTVLFATLICLAAKGHGKKVKFDEIDAERVNIVEPDGKIRLTLANRERMPGGTLAGVELSARNGNRTLGKDGTATAGIIFFNDKGDECGGLTYGSKMVNGKPVAFAHFSFDHYDQNESIAISHGEEDSTSRSGLEVWDAGLPITADAVQQYNAAMQMKDGPEKDAAMKKLSSEHEAEFKFTPRLFVGHLAEDNAAAVILMDAQSRPRIRMVVDASDKPSLQFLDEQGKVTQSLPSNGGNTDHPTP